MSVDSGFHFRDSYFPAAEARRAVVPSAVDALNREGRALRERGQISAAIAKHQEALRLKPDAAATYQHLALAWWRRGNLPEAIAAYRRAMELRPNSAAAHSDYLYALYHDARRRPEHLLAETQRWAGKFARSNGQKAVGSKQGEGGGLNLEDGALGLNPEPRTLNPDKLRIGYVSADFRRHTLRHFISPLLKFHDRSAVQVFCYSNVAEPDTVTEELRPLADQWREVRKLKAQELAETIRRDQIDILVDLSGHMGGNRLTTFAMKPAPVQVQIYFAGTSGLPQMDYRITDEYSDPFDLAHRGAPGSESLLSSTPTPALARSIGRGRMDGSFCTEQLVRLASCAWPYEPEEKTPDVGPLPAQSNGYITFGSMNRPIKISERMIGLWWRILQAVPKSKLLFLADAVPSDVEYHYQRFARHGIGPDRLIPLARTSRRKYLETFNRIDLCLDTFPYAGDTTTCDALWMGVPTLTLAGNCFHSRRGVSHLSNVGLQQWIAGSEDEYVLKAIAFAQNLSALSHLRSELRDRMRRSPLMDFIGYARKLEAAYRQMCSDLCEQSIDVRPPATNTSKNSDELEPLRQFFAANPAFVTPADCGIVTASDGKLFRGLQMLLLSIKGQSPAAVFDLGLSEDQRTWCRALENVRLMKPPMLPVPKTLEMWQGWNKPFYLKASPFERTIWIDADAFVLGDLSPLFAAATEGFWVIKHQLRYPKSNDPRLYQARPVRRRFAQGFHLNDGVVGCRRGNDVLETWAAAVVDFTSNPQLRSWTSYYDEGALHWAIESLGCHEKVFDRPPWNQMFYDLGRRYPTLQSFTEHFDRTAKVIVHATGPKLWSGWDCSFLA